MIRCISVILCLYFLVTVHTASARTSSDETLLVDDQEQHAFGIAPAPVAGHLWRFDLGVRGKVVDYARWFEDGGGYGEEHGEPEERESAGDAGEGRLSRILGLAQETGLDVWHVERGSHVDVYIPEQKSQTQTQTLALDALSSFPHTKTPIHVDQTAPSPDTWRNTTASLANTTFHGSYHRLSEVESFMRGLADAFPARVSLVRLGHSGEAREMYALRISSGPLLVPERRAGADGRRKKKSGKKGKERKNGKREDKGEVDAKHVPHLGEDVGTQGKRKREHDRTKKLAMVIVGAQHAREWIATATSLYIAHALVVDPSPDEPRSLSSLLKLYDFYIIPSPNPDGYDYTWEVDRFWYKTRQKLRWHAKCDGLDMNRNWVSRGYKWKRTVPPETGPDLSMPGSNETERVRPKREELDPCSHWFPGYRPFQSPEVNNIANYVMTLPNLIAFLDLRSYGQMMSSPYSYSCKRIPDDAEDLLEGALGAVSALRDVHGAAFTTGRLCEMLYRAPGNIVDWMYAKAGIKFSYAVHLRDTGTYGFALPPKWIRPVGEETGEMLRYLGSFIAESLRR